MIWRKFVRDQAARAFEKLQATYVESLQGFVLESRDEPYRALRDELLEASKMAWSIAQESRSKKYTFDLEFGLRMYASLYKNGFTEWNAADNGVWSYLSIRIIPDIVYGRCEGYNEDRFYKRNWRILLKDLWWYIHTTEEGGDKDFDMEGTRKILARNSEDIMFLLLDHLGYGFRPRVYHLLMRRYSELLDSGIQLASCEDFFRAIMLLHQVRTEVIDPILQGEEAYVEGLFERVLPQFTELNHGS